MCNRYAFWIKRTWSRRRVQYRWCIPVRLPGELLLLMEITTILYTMRPRPESISEWNIEYIFRCTDIASDFILCWNGACESNLLPSSLSRSPSSLCWGDATIVAGCLSKVVLSLADLVCRLRLVVRRPFCRRWVERSQNPSEWFLVWPSWRCMLSVFVSDIC